MTEPCTSAAASSRRGTTEEGIAAILETLAITSFVVGSILALALVLTSMFVEHKCPREHKVQEMPLYYIEKDECRCFVHDGERCMVRFCGSKYNPAIW